MIIPQHTYSGAINNILDRLNRFAIDFTDSLALDVVKDVDNDVKVVFDNKNTPSNPSTFNDLIDIVDRLVDKYKNANNNEDEEFYRCLCRLSDRLNNENLCGEEIYFPWFKEDYFNSPNTKIDTESIRQAILSVQKGSKTLGTYSHKYKKITLYSKNIGNDPDDYISVFAHEYFHAVHHFLLDKYCSAESLTCYYHSVVFESLATYFQIEFLKLICKDFKADDVFNGICGFSPIFYPYSGAKYFYQGANYNNVLQKSFGSFRDSLCDLIYDKNEIKIIMQCFKETKSFHFPVMDDLILEKSKELAAMIIELCSEVSLMNVPQSIVDNLFRSGTQIGAGIYKAQFPVDKKDYNLLIKTAIQYCRECEYWLGILIMVFGTYATDEEKYKINNIIQICKTFSNDLTFFMLHNRCPQ